MFTHARQDLSIFLTLFALLAPLVAANDLESDLLRAAKKGQTHKVRVLLEQGADVDAQDKKGRTALMLASQKRRTQTVEFLLERGADVTLVDRGGESALDKSRSADVEKLIRGRIQELAEEEAWLTVEREDTIAGYQRYVETSPPYRFKKKAEDRLDDLHDEAFRVECESKFKILEARVLLEPQRFARGTQISITSAGVKEKTDTAEMAPRSDHVFLLTKIGFPGLVVPEQGSLQISDKNVALIDSDGSETTPYMKGLLRPGWAKGQGLNLRFFREVEVLFVLRRDQLSNSKIRFATKVLPLEVAAAPQ